MATYKRFEELDVWQSSRELSKQIFAATAGQSFARDYSLKDQINRASGSVMDNIAEGFGRDGNREFIQYLSLAKASVDEIQSQLYRALDRKHIAVEDFENLYSKADIIRKKLAGFIHYLKRCEMKGLKFRQLKVTGIGIRNKK